MQCFLHVVIAAAIPISYVGSLYIVEHKLRASHPMVLKKRFRAVGVVCALSIIISYILLRGVVEHPLEAMGLHWHGTIAATIFPLLLTSIFYLGSLIIFYLDGSFNLLFSAKEWRKAVRDVHWLRHTVMGPLTEEIAFRACSTTLLYTCASTAVTTMVGPMFFSISHMHHIRDDLRNGISMKSALSYRIFQLAYTYLFGVYATYIFLQTGHIIAPILVHSLCNTIGLPLLSETSQYTGKVFKLIWTAHIIGIISWMFLLPYLLSPTLYTFL